MKASRLTTGFLVAAGIVLLGLGLPPAVSILKRRGADDQPRRLLIDCPDINSSAFGVELANLRSDIALDSIAGVVDAQGQKVPWRLSADRSWIVFKGQPGEAYEVLIAPGSGTPSPPNHPPIPGMLTLTYSGVWVRKGDDGARREWFSRRLARVVGAVHESQGQTAVDRALETHARALQIIGIQEVAPAPPFDLERDLVAEQPDFSKLLGQMLKAELQARTEIFVTAKRVLKNNKAHSHSVDVAQVRAWDVSNYEGIAASLKGRLFFEKQTTVTFNVYALFGGAFFVDGNPVAMIRLSRYIQPDGWRVRVPVTFKPGFHDIELIVQGKRQDMKAGITWIPPDGGQERHMIAGDFCPAPRARIRGLVSSNRRTSYPLIQLTRLGRTGFFKRARYWSKLQRISGQGPWTVNGRSIQGQTIQVCCPAEKAVQIGLQDRTIALVPEKKRFRYLGGSVDVLTELPHFLFNDEELKARVVFRSEAEVPLDMNLEVIHTRKGKPKRVLADRTVTLSGRGARINRPLEPTGSGAAEFDLNGRKLKIGDGLDTKAFCLPEAFLDEQIKIIKPTACAGIQCDDTGRLYDASGCPVLVRLTRPSLGDKRRWGVVKHVLTVLRPPKHLLVLAAPEEWGDEKFLSALEDRARKRGSTVKLEPWAETPAGVPRLLGSIGRVAEMLESGHYDGVLIIPPLGDLAAGSDTRTLSRAAACVTEIASGHLGRQRVWLAVPPGWAPDKMHSETFEKQLRKVAGDYGIHTVPLATWLESGSPNLATAYEDGGMVQPGPVGLYSEVATYLIQWIYGDVQ